MDAARDRLRPRRVKVCHSLRALEDHADRGPCRGRELQRGDGTRALGLRNAKADDRRDPRGSRAQILSGLPAAVSRSQQLFARRGQILASLQHTTPLPETDGAVARTVCKNGSEKHGCHAKVVSVG